MKIVVDYTTKADGWNNGALTPKGVMVHSTATPGVMAQQFRDRWNKPNMGKSIHAFLDDKEIVQCLPFSKKAGHAGGSANSTHIGFEICEPSGFKYSGNKMIGYDVEEQQSYFNAIWKNAVEFTAYLCTMFKFDPTKEGVVICHSEGGEIGVASNHSDVMHWFPKHGVDMDDFRSAVVKAMKTGVAENLPSPTPEPTPAEEKTKITFDGDEFEAEVPLKQFRIALADMDKRKYKGNYCSGGYFGGYDEGNDHFTLPSGHVVCDFEAASKWTKKYCEERGTFDGDKFTFNSSLWSYQNKLYGKKVSIMYIHGGEVKIAEISEIPPCEYAIAGIPIIRNGTAVSYSTVTVQGWDTSSLRATYHTFLAIKEGKLFVMGKRTKTSNCISSGEAAKLFDGYDDVIKLDGGGSYYAKVGGNTATTGGSRQICTFLDLGEIEASENPYPEPTRNLKRGSYGPDVRWLQFELGDVTIDGDFGTATDKSLRAFQKAHGLSVDGICGPATRAKLKEV